MGEMLLNGRVPLDWERAVSDIAVDFATARKRLVTP
jgi:hypothetical protein